MESRHQTQMPLQMPEVLHPELHLLQDSGLALAQLQQPPYLEFEASQQQKKLAAQAQEQAVREVRWTQSQLAEHCRTHLERHVLSSACAPHQNKTHWSRQAYPCLAPSPPVSASSQHPLPSPSSPSQHFPADCGIHPHGRAQRHRLRSTPCESRWRASGCFHQRDLLIRTLALHADCPTPLAGSRCCGTERCTSHHTSSRW